MRNERGTAVYADNIGRVITNYVNEDGKSYAYISADLMGVRVLDMKVCGVRIQ